jgi:FAD/FMN-containing dehydrogenase
MDSFDKVTALLNDLQRDLAGTLSAYEVMWGEYFRGVTGDNGHRPPMRRDYPFYVVVEAEGADAEADAVRFERLLEMAFEKEMIIDAVIPKSESERREVWNIREDFEVILPGFLYDVSLPISSMGLYMEKVHAGIKRKWPQGECFALGHIADGNLHLFTRPNTKGDWHLESDKIVYAPLQELGGSVSAEHGIGTEKIRWLPSSRTREEISMMRLLKTTLDPCNLLNPGRVIPA